MLILLIFLSLFEVLVDTELIDKYLKTQKEQNKRLIVT